jgi:ABC-2 type transport system permease protein
MSTSIILKTIIYRETKRFLNVYNQTLIAPAINALLFFTIFTVIFSQRQSIVLNYEIFVASGLIVMSMMQNAYANTQSTMTTAKVLGFAVDTIIPPIPKIILLIGFISGGLIRGLLVGTIILILFAFLAKFHIQHPFILIFYSIFACTLFSLLGVIVGSISKNFDSSVSYNTYLITPITMLSCTFYSIKMLPEFWQKVTLFNPIFYIVDSFRFAIIGTSNSPFNVVTQMIFLISWILILGLIAYHLLKTKYHEM